MVEHHMRRFLQQDWVRLVADVLVKNHLQKVRRESGGIPRLDIQLVKVRRYLEGGI